MFPLPYTQDPAFNHATDEALAAFQRGDELEAITLLIAAVSDLRVPPDQEHAKAKLILQMRGHRLALRARELHARQKAGAK